MYARWDLADIVVTLDGVGEDLDSGMVTIDTPAAAKLRASWQQAETSTARPL